jgi:ketosteroid isomerase-like protein
VDRKGLAEWIAGYERAWRSPGTGALAELFTKDASYSTAPYEKPHKGLEAIREMWEAERLGPDEEFEMRTEVVAIDGDTGVVRIEVRYGEPKGKEYRDLWILQLDENGLCSHFEEWPFWPPDQQGAPAAGA